jgi:G3E family GTPase
MMTRLVFVGGFLGAGKTTLLLRAAQLLAGQGRRVGIITNDQGRYLVDTALVGQQDVPRVEVAGGCFCCRFPDLLASIRTLQAEAHPDVILAEPVGSCTDLAATVLRPLHAQYPGEFELAPLTILVDPLREPARFPTVVDYLYQRQLAEADIIALSKRDLLALDMAQETLNRLQARNPNADVLGLAARTGEGVAGWLDRCLTRVSALDQDLELDYERYAEAEACLGWLNATGSLDADRPFAPAEWLARILTALEQRFAGQDAQIAHVKLHVTMAEGTLKASLTQLGNPISWDTPVSRSATQQAQFILNARVNTIPTTLESIVRRMAAEVSAERGIRCKFSYLECFSPLPPQPTFRLHCSPRRTTAG